MWDNNSIFDYYEQCQESAERRRRRNEVVDDYSDCDEDEWDWSWIDDGDGDIYDD